MKTVTIIDTFGFFFSRYYALPKLTNKDGFPTQLLTGFANLIMQIGKDYKSDYILFALDSEGKTFRNDIYDAYKANRSEAPEDLKRQLPIAIEWIHKMGFKSLQKSGYEADDVIASATAMLKKQDIITRIVSFDKDLYQLIDNNVFIFNPTKKIEIRDKECFDKFAVHPNEMITYQSIVGDSVDNIMGVKGIGAKGAVKLVEQYKSLEDIYSHLDDLHNERTKKLLLASKKSAFLSRELVTLKTDILDDIDINELSLPQTNPLLNIKDELIKYDLHYVLDRLSKNGLYIKTKEPESVFKPDFELIDTRDKLEKLRKLIKDNDIVAIDTETNSLDTKEADIIGISLSICKIRGYYLPIAHNYLGVSNQLKKEEVKEFLKSIQNSRFLFHNYKYDHEIIRRNFDISLDCYVDTMLLAYLIEPENAHSLDYLMKKYFKYKMISFSDVVEKGKDFSSVNIDEACKYAGEDAVATYILYLKLQDEATIKNKGMLKILEELEIPFVKTLIDMENNGIKVDIKELDNLLTYLAQELIKIEKIVYELTAHEFNLASPKQLGEILFKELNIDASKHKIKKIKTGFSTDESSLNKIVNEHECIKHILKHRELNKLKGMIPSLLNYAKSSKTHRIHSSFKQTGTSTGRLSSLNPNLQNIPVRSEVGKRVRKAFIARDGYKLVSIDYSQIELRLLAHFSKDSSMIDAFQNNKDIHLRTSEEIFGKEEASTHRHIAKSINFGLIYGMGARRLAETISVSNDEARQYIEKYFNSFPTIKNYLEYSKQKVHDMRYSETILKRRRYYDFASANSREKAMYEREAVNYIFQGSAADIIKLAMNKIDNLIKEKYQDKAYLILQIHDELVFEIEEKYLEEISQVFLDIMENIVTLNIPLKCSMSIGRSWDELK